MSDKRKEKRAKAKRYIVCVNGRPLMIGHYDDTPLGGVLMYGEVVTAMPRSTAKRAMKRTAEYAKKRGLDWECENNRMFLLVENARGEVAE